MGNRLDLDLESKRVLVLAPTERRRLRPLAASWDDVQGLLEHRGAAP
jgi:virulence-associated protein VagC